MNKIWFSGIAIASIMALVACGNSTTGSAGGSGGSIGNGGSGGSIGGGGAIGGGGGTGGGSCFDCACTNKISEGGCADICTMGLNGTTNPNFCDGSNALSQCAACIASTCGESDPTACGM